MSSPITHASSFHPIPPVVPSTTTPSAEGHSTTKGQEWTASKVHKVASSLLNVLSRIFAIIPRLIHYLRSHSFHSVESRTGKTPPPSSASLGSTTPSSASSSSYASTSPSLSEETTKISPAEMQKREMEALFTAVTTIKAVPPSPLRQALTAMIQLGEAPTPKKLGAMQVGKSTFRIKRGDPKAIPTPYNITVDRGRGIGVIHWREEKRAKTEPNLREQEGSYKKLKPDYLIFQFDGETNTWRYESHLTALKPMVQKFKPNGQRLREEHPDYRRSRYISGQFQGEYEKGEGLQSAFIASPVAVLSIGKARKAIFQGRSSSIGRFPDRELIITKRYHGDFFNYTNYMTDLAEEGRFHRDIVPTFQELIERFHDVSLGVKTLHDKGMVHLDIKPENIFLSRGNKGTSSQAALGDLDFLTADGTLSCAGTPGYAAPEVLRDGDATTKADIYSLGKTIQAIAHVWSTLFYGEDQVRIDKQLGKIYGLCSRMLDARYRYRPDIDRVLLSLQKIHHSLRQIA